MTTDPITREDLEMAAKAAGLEVESIDMDAGKGWVYVPHAPASKDDDERQIMLWRPHTDDGDCARMCAAVGIDTKWCRYDPLVTCVAQRANISGTLALFSDHANDKCAAWRYASVKLAAAVGMAM